MLKNEDISHEDNQGDTLVVYLLKHHLKFFLIKIFDVVVFVYRYFVAQ